MKVILHQEIGVLSEYLASVLMNVHLKSQIFWKSVNDMHPYQYAFTFTGTWSVLMNRGWFGEARPTCNTKGPHSCLPVVSPFFILLPLFKARPIFKLSVSSKTDWSSLSAVVLECYVMSGSSRYAFVYFTASLLKARNQIPHERPDSNMFPAVDQTRGSCTWCKHAAKFRVYWEERD